MPLYSSVHDTTVGDPDVSPLKAKAAFWVPAPAKPNLPVIKVPPPVQEVPLYSSLGDKNGNPPKAKASFWVPAPAKPDLAVIKTPPAVHIPSPT